MVLIVLLAVLLGGLAWSNRSLPESSLEPEKLQAQDLAKVQEATHLRRMLGEEVWPGWDSLHIPFVVYNESHVFAIDIDDPSTGWRRVPFGDARMDAWERVEGSAYFRAPLQDTGYTPQAFMVSVGEQFAASMTTHEWTGVRMVREIRNQVPGFLAPFMPYRLIGGQFNSDWYIAALLHESFHVYQATQAYDRLVSAEEATSLGADYPWGQPAFMEAWSRERRLLAKALSATNPDTLARLADRWLNQRAQRRRELPEELADYEKKREWLEGLAKYVEIAIWEAAYLATDYEPLAEMDRAGDFNRYGSFPEYFGRERNQLQSDLQSDEVIFYYSGWAQASLLDKLHAGWKYEIMKEGVFLEDLIRKALSGQA